MNGALLETNLFRVVTTALDFAYALQRQGGFPPGVPPLGSLRRFLEDIRTSTGPGAVPRLWASERRMFPPALPYLSRSDGSYEIPRQGMRVVVLGDLPAVRTCDLLAQGHQVTLIDKDPETLEVANIKIAGDIQKGRFKEGRYRVELTLADWFASSTDGDYVEAFYPFPLIRSDPSSIHSPEPTLEDFLYQALLTKLVPNARGGVFVISEDRTPICSLADIVRRDSALELLAIQHSWASHQERKPPIVGGFGTMWKTASYSSLVFRRRG